MQSTNIAVRVDDLKKEFGHGDARLMVLRGVNFEARFGEMAFLVGPSGSGKTTLLSVIAGLLDSTAGSLSVLGEDVEGLPPRERILFRRKNLGFVFQQYNLLPALTAAENVAVPLLAAGVTKAEALERAATVLTSLRMGARLHSFPSQLSGGEQQRVALARAVIHGPRLIVCDEPTAALDAATGHTVMELLSEVALRPDRAVIVVTHDNRILNFADRTAFMEDGLIARTEVNPRRLKHKESGDSLSIELNLSPRTVSGPEDRLGAASGSRQ
jgi:putative ABC transport system ATP-binding protein